MRRGWTALAALLAAVGCDRDEDAPRAAAQAPAPVSAAPEPPRQADIGVVTQVIVRIVDGPESVESRGRELGIALGQQLGDSPLFVAEGQPVPAGRRARRLEVEALVSSDVVDGARHGGASLVTTVSAHLRWLDAVDGPELREDVLLERPLERGDRERVEVLAPDQAVAAVATAGRGLIAKEALRRGSDADIVAALSDPDPHRVAWALALAGDRRLEGAVPATIAKLDAGSELVRDAAFTALVAIGDPRAVEALTRRVDFQDYDQLRAVIEAVSVIGGSEATAFLEFVASGHPESSIRALAAERLAGR